MENIYFLKKDVLKNFANFTGKHLCWGIFLIKSQVFGEHLWTTASKLYLKRDSNTGVLWIIQEHLL